MKSKTKYNTDNCTIEQVFVNAELGNTLSLTLLNKGEYNTAYHVVTDTGEYVIKIAPKSSAKVLTYEHNLMAQEVYFYKLIAEKTNVKIPKVYFYDDSEESIPSPYFIMEKLRAKPVAESRLDKNTKAEVYKLIGGILPQLHCITHAQYGYRQNGLHENWYLAIKSMVTNLIDDCNKCNKKAKSGYKLLEFIEYYKQILLGVSATYTHFDIWDGNIFYNKKADNSIELSLIDMERSYWGDYIGEFVSIEIFKELNKKVSVVEYNRTAKSPVTYTNEELVRFNIMRAYLGLIVYSEKFVRYHKLSIKYISNIIIAKYLLGKSFKALKKYKR